MSIELEVRPCESRPGPGGPAQTQTLRPNAAVWIERPDAQHPGLVLAANSAAVTVRYRATAGRGTMVDTVPADRVRPRREPDVIDDLDRTGGGVRRVG